MSDLGRPGRRRDYRCAVLGLGALGSAAAYWLARRLEDDVVGLEQFEMGHTKGASEDHSRIIRRSYHTPWYVALTAAAYEAWAEVERRAGEQLVLRTGGLDLWPRDAAIPMRDYVESMRACEVPFEELEAGEVARRWPQWNLSDDVRALYQPDAGLCAASRCNAAHRRLAEEEGAELRDRSAVTAIRHAGGEVEIESATGRIRCETLVVAADSWTNQVLAMLGERPLPLTVTKEQVVYFATPDPDLFSPERFPIWIWMDDPCFYGFPAFGEPGPKARRRTPSAWTTHRTRPPWTGSAGSRRSACRGPGAPSSRCGPAGTPCHPTATSWSTGCRIFPTSSCCWVPHTGSSSRRCSGRSRHSWPWTGGATST